MLLRRGILSSGVLSGYTGIADAVTGATWGVSNQLLTRAYTDYDNNVRTDAQYEIDFVDNKFSGADWDTATGAYSSTIPPLTSWVGGIAVGDVLTDASASSAKFQYLDVTQQVAGSDGIFSFHLDYENDETVIPKFRLQFITGGVTQNADLWVNKKTGANSSTGAASVSVTGNSVDGWDCTVYDSDITANTHMFLYMYPSYSTTLGGAQDNTLMGSITVTGISLTELSNGLPYNTTWYDQIGSNNAAQGTASLQPIVTREGVGVFDGAGDYMESATPATQPTTKFSGFVSVEINGFAANQGIIAQDTVTGKRQWNLHIASADKLKFTVSIGASFQTIELTSASTKLVGLVGIGWSYDSVTGFKLYVDGVLQTIVGSISGTFDTDTTPLAIGSLTGGVFWPLNGEINTAVLWLDTLSAADQLLVYNTWVANNV